MHDPPLHVACSESSLDRLSSLHLEHVDAVEHALVHVHLPLDLFEFLLQLGVASVAGPDI